MKVAELEGTLLDYWVAKAVGAKDVRIEDYSGLGAVCVVGDNVETPIPCRASTNWAQGGPIIEREKISVKWRRHTGVWKAYHINSLDDMPAETGETALIAAMRLYVASKYGEEVPHESI